MFNLTTVLISRPSRARPWRTVAALLLLIGAPAGAHDGVVLEGRGSAVVDGTLAAGEWDAAGRVAFRAKLPPRDGGGDTPATLLVMQDGENLYLAVRIERAAYGLTQPIFEFDNDHDGLWFEPGDDIVHMFVGDFEAPRFFDVFRHPCLGSADQTFAGCSSVDTAAGGTTDGDAAASNDGVYTVIEMSHPLNDGDDAHDLNLSGGAAVGFQFTLHLFSLDRSCNFGAECVVDTHLAGDIGATRASPAVVIDVMPGSSVNPVNVASRGVIPVAILGTPAFDALSVDPLSVCFGSAGDPARRDCNEAHSRGHGADVNADGLADLVLHFETRETGIAAGDTRACLTGRTDDGSEFEGCDAIRADAQAANASALPRRGRMLDLRRKPRRSR